MRELFSSRTDPCSQPFSCIDLVGGPCLALGKYWIRHWTFIYRIPALINKKTVWQDLNERLPGTFTGCVHALTGSVQARQGQV